MKKSLFILFPFVATLLIGQELKLPRLFTNGAVLQREMPVRFWGWSGPNEVITISIDGFDVRTKANNNGKWEALYPAHAAGGPFEVKVDIRKGY